MTSPYRKKLIEVALPLEAINVASAREKSIRHGHPSTLHLWWARRPLAACRAVLFASLVDDPDSDPAYAHYDAETREHMAGEKRQQLFDLITELVQWENSNNELVINAARAEIARCVASRKIELGELKKDHQLPGGETVYDLVVKGHGDLAKLREGKVRLPKAESVNAFLAEHAPPVLDPFAGGGSIPLEARRLGLRAYASDLNPVPVLINKAQIEIPAKFTNKPPVNPNSIGDAGPAGKKGKSRGRSVLGQSQWRGAQGLAEDVRYYGRWICDEARKRIAHLYPTVKVTADMSSDRPDLKPYIGEELTVIAWLWARTVSSPNPAAGGAHVPLLRSFWLNTKKGSEAWVQPVIDRASCSYRFEVHVGKPPQTFDPTSGTIRKNLDICLITGSPLPRAHIRAEGMAHRLGQRLLAVVAEGKNERVFLSPPSDHEAIVEHVEPNWKPDSTIPNTRYTTPVIYGMSSHADLFTCRQLVVLDALSQLVVEARQQLLQEPSANVEYANAVATYLAFGVSKVADRGSTLTSWDVSRAIRSTFGRQALSMTWDFAEANPFSSSSGNWIDALEWTVECLEASPEGPQGSAEQMDAAHAISRVQTPLVSTDPPYYDNVPYADLSDFFYVWLRRSLSTIYPTLLSTLLVPKEQELVADLKRHGGVEAARDFFENGMKRVFVSLRAGCTHEAPTTIYYAFKQAEDDDVSDDGSNSARSSTGWETFLQGLVDAGWSIHGTWPMRTELSNRMRNIDSNALASSVVLVCRSREVAAPLATRREFLNAMKRELPEALRHLQRGSIAPVDLAQASIGPGMAVFTRYAKVMEADGSPMKVRQALALINQTLDEVLAEQEGEFDGDTRWAVAWFEQFGMDEGSFGAAETLSKAKNTAVNTLVEAGIIYARGGKVRLLKREELPTDWNPATDNKVRHWEVAQHLIHSLETGGETAAADLLRKVGGMGEVARDLAYRLYSLCERKKWASEALAYNGLAIAWPEISKLAQQAPATQTGEQLTFGS